MRSQGQPGWRALRGQEARLGGGCGGAGAGWEDTGPSQGGPEASRGVSEGLVTKEGWPQVGWGLMAVPRPVSGGPGPPRPPA